MKKFFASLLGVMFSKPQIVNGSRKGTKTQSFVNQHFASLRLCVTLVAVLLGTQAIAQHPGGGGQFDPSKMNVGRFYGKVVDENRKGVGYATVQLFGKKFDPETKTLKEALLAGQLTESNGDFNLEKLPVAGEFTLKISFLGYTEVTRTVSFGVKPPTPGGGGMPPSGSGGGMPGGGGFPAGNFEKDLGNIPLVEESRTLGEVTVAEKASVATLALDKKIYKVDKDLTAAGGSAQDALKNVPSLSVDLEGNVSLRNGAPQIFVDGRPSALTLDQIPADAIDNVEVITNPSSKYDAGGGTAGIVNIVLKKEKRLGYNGNLRLGADSRGGANLGGDLNARGQDLNLFGSLNINRSRNINEAETFRQNLLGNPRSNVTQHTDGRMRGLFMNGRAGVDWLMDNRNTLTISGSYMRGAHTPSDEITNTTDLFFPTGTMRHSSVRNTQQDRTFQNIGSTVAFKHLFPRQGAEWTADVNYNIVRFKGKNDYTTDYDFGLKTIEKQENRGRGNFVTIQTDFVNPLNDKTKIEGGVRAFSRTNRNDNGNFFLDEKGIWVLVPNLADHYRYRDDVYAAYGQFSQLFKKWSYQIGLRAESSFYRGELTDRDSSFTIVYPLSLFPTAFLTYKISDSENLQLSATRRVNRPNFFQNSPFVDFSDSLNIRRGNPQLRPEFTWAGEVSYQKIFSKGHNLLASVYVKRATDLITAYLTSEFNADLNRDIVVTTYANSNTALAYGLELTVKNSFFKWLDLTTNVNLYQSQVDGTNVETSLEISRLSGFFKENMQVKLPRGFSFQLSGEYRTRASYTPTNNNDPFRHGPGGGLPASTAQGFSRANWFADVSLRKDFWKNKASLTLSVSDVFATRKNGQFTESDLFVQDAWRIHGPQTARLNFSYRFGKLDASLFKRKNMKVNMQGADMM